MILMMVLPLLLITVLPKMMNDPETKREMEQMHQSMNVQNQVISNIENQVEIDVQIFHLNYCSHGPRFFNFYDFTQVPEISEIMANLFGGGGSGGTSADKAKKKQKPHVTRRS